MAIHDTDPDVLWTLTQPDGFNIDELRDRVKWLRDHYPYADMDEADKEDAEAELQDLEPVLDQYTFVGGATFYRYDWWDAHYIDQELENYEPLPAWLCIDWDATAREVKQDFEEVNILGTDYYVRSW